MEATHEPRQPYLPVSDAAAALLVSDDALADLAGQIMSAAGREPAAPQRPIPGRPHVPGRRHPGGAGG